MLCKYYNILTNTLMTLMRDQGTQMSAVTMALTVCQLGRTYRAGDLRFGPPISQHACLLVVLQIWMSLLLPVGLTASSDLTIPNPLYHLLLRMS